MKILDIINENQINKLSSEYVNDLITDMTEYEEYFEIRNAMGEADAGRGINKTDFLVPLGRLVEKTLATRGIELNDKSHWEIVENVFITLVKDVQTTGDM